MRTTGPGSCRLTNIGASTPWLKAIIGLFKTEVIKFLGPWKSVGQIEWETPKWVTGITIHACTALSDMPRHKKQRRNTEKP